MTSASRQCEHREGSPTGWSVLCAFLGSLFALALGAGASTVDFADSFSYADGTPLQGTNGWTVSGNGTAFAENGVARVSDATIANAFTDSQTAVWTDFYLQPTFGESDDTPGPPAGASFAFYVNTASNVVVYDGTSQVTTGVTVEEGAWTRFTVHSDYGTDTWDLYVDGVAVTNGLGFYNTDTASFGKFGVLGAGSNDLLDDLHVDIFKPAFLLGQPTLFRFR